MQQQAKPWISRQMIHIKNYFCLWWNVEIFSCGGTIPFCSVVNVSMPDPHLWGIKNKGHRTINFKIKIRKNNRFCLVKQFLFTSLVLFSRRTQKTWSMLSSPPLFPPPQKEALDGSLPTVYADRISCKRSLIMAPFCSASAEPVTRNILNSPTSHLSPWRGL